jgi:hypothetical protein
MKDYVYRVHTIVLAYGSTDQPFTSIITSTYYYDHYHRYYYQHMYYCCLLYCYPYLSLGFFSTLVSPNAL